MEWNLLKKQEFQMLKDYLEHIHSQLYFKFIKSFSQGGFADLRQVHLWNLGFIKDKTKGKYKEIEDKISDACFYGSLELIQIIIDG